MKKEKTKENKLKKIINKIKTALSKSDKKSLTVYIILRVLVILCMIREIILGDIQNAMLCVLSLILFLLPALVERTFKVDLPNILEITILIFIFSAEILGEINNFYGIFKNFDDILHTINGFLAASVGFSLVYLLNKNIDSFNLSPLFVSLVAFCFSMTIGVLWEFFEYGMDTVFNFDTQKDTYIEKINTVTLDPTNSNKVININDIDHTTLYDKENKELTTIKGYLDIGIIDTMEDLIVNFIGALTYSVFGYLYILNKEKNIASKFIIKKKIA